MLCSNHLSLVCNVCVPVSELLAPYEEYTPSPLPIEASSTTVYPPNPNFRPSPSTLVPITAGPNDSLLKIASRTGAPFLAIEAANPLLVGTPIQAGQTVLIPNGPPQTVAILAKPGDTLSTIAARNNVSLLAIEAANMDVVPDKIKEGDIIQVPVNSVFPTGLRKLQQTTPGMICTHLA